MSTVEALIWYGTWPVLIYVGYKFVSINIKQLDKTQK